MAEDTVLKTAGCKSFASSILASSAKYKANYWKVASMGISRLEICANGNVEGSIPLLSANNMDFLAHLVRASDCGSEGDGFETRRSPT